MSTESSDIDLIERYINGKLTASEAESFEIRITKDREFARKCRLIKTFPELMTEAGHIEYEKTLAEKTAETIIKKDRPSLRPKYIVVFTIGAIIIGLLIFLLTTKKDHPAEKSTFVKNIPVKIPPTVPQVKQIIKVTEKPVAVSPMKKPIELEAPADGMTFTRKTEVLFKWKMETDSFTNFYIFSEIDNKLVWWRGIKPGIREYKLESIKFHTGRFFWYVGTKKIKRTFIVDE